MRSEDLARIAHDPGAFEAFYREHVEGVQRFVARRVDDPHLAADLTADVFLAAIEGRRLVDADDIARMQDRIDAEARRRELYAALAVLPEGERAVFELIALDDLTPREAAAVLGIRAVTARV